jgi:hypothetical protein
MSIIATLSRAFRSLGLQPKHAIFVLVALTVTVPFFFKNVEQKFEPSVDVRKVFDKIDSLKPGSHVLLSFDYDPASEAELYPMSLALLRHCFRKGVIPIVMTHWVTGVGMGRRALEDTVGDPNAPWAGNLESGRDYVFLGYSPGTSSLVYKMVDNFKGAFEKDASGRSTRTMKALEGVNSLRDFDLLVDIAAGATVEMWIAYGADRANVPMAAGTTAVSAPNLYPFYQSGQLIGFLGGLRGAADYEKLLKWPGRGEQGMLAQSATHVLIILLIVYANIRMFAGRASRKART